MSVLLKESLTRVGERMSERGIARLNSTIDYLEVGRWLRAEGLPVPHRVQSREELFALAAAEMSGRRPLYLEFGVAEGASLRSWAALLSDPEARFVGFDTFTGLPEAWNATTGEGSFGTGGVPPEIADDRVSFAVGRFDDTLPSFVPPPHDVLFVNVDCDLYASARVVLEHVAPWLHPGSFLYFDEFSDRNHELRAFREFRARAPLSFVVRGATRPLAQILFQRTA